MSWLDDLNRDGYCVVPDVIPQEVCAEFQESALSWLENFGKGFRRDDKSTWTTEHLPRSKTGGLYACHGVNHESWMWKVRSQPAIRDVFARVWGTPDLVVSFDACNITQPVNGENRTDIEPTAPWPHMDQNARLVGHRQEVQGIANLYPSGPDDGGLVVVRGSHRLHGEYFGPFTGDVDPETLVAKHHFKMDELDWYLKHGGEIVKVCANPGDVILWDSRTIHWNASPIGQQTRFATYVAWAPRAWMTESQLNEKLANFRARIPTGHIAAKNPSKENVESRCEEDRQDGARSTPVRPRQEPQETPEILWAVGVRT